MFFLLDALVYHNDPVGSTSELGIHAGSITIRYTIMTR